MREDMTRDQYGNTPLEWFDGQSKTLDPVRGMSAFFINLWLLIEGPFMRLIRYLSDEELREDGTIETCMNVDGIGYLEGYHRNEQRACL